MAETVHEFAGRGGAGAPRPLVRHRGLVRRRGLAGRRRPQPYGGEQSQRHGEQARRDGERGRAAAETQREAAERRPRHVAEPDGEQAHALHPRELVAGGEAGRQRPDGGHEQRVDGAEDERAEDERPQPRRPGAQREGHREDDRAAHGVAAEDHPARPVAVGDDAAAQHQQHARHRADGHDEADPGGARDALRGPAEGEEADAVADHGGGVRREPAQHGAVAVRGRGRCPVRRHGRNGNP
ncbi:hypothetical protein GCM10009801_34540 [Streptomyces albiaxialis]|uniref:Uncharacterized protein n=1 Tax=Streptomyces albiaxialis TaxID=329523 RepID=A0ABN2VZU6_9ACTN